MSETLVCDYRKVPISYQDRITSNYLKRQSGCYINFNDHANHRIVDITQKSVTAELIGEPEKIDAFIELMKQFGVKEISRTGVTAVSRG